MTRPARNTVAAIQRKPAGDRQRQQWRESKARWRAAFVAGRGSWTVPAKDANAVVELLLDLGWAQEHESENRKEIGRAIGALLDDLAASHAKRKR